LARSQPALRDALQAFRARQADEVMSMSLDSDP
jgi:hypothetical protein